MFPLGGGIGAAPTNRLNRPVFPATQTSVALRTFPAGPGSQRMGRALLNWLKASLDGIRTSLWMLPALMFLMGAGLAVLMLRHGEAIAASEVLAPWVSSGQGEDARNLLSTLLTSVITMAGVIFSATIVALALAASSHGPRLIRTFRANRGTQLAIGAFAMTIVYLLLVLRAIRGDAAAADVPHLAVTVGAVLALACVLALLGFMQGVASLIVADEVIRRVRKEFDDAIADLPFLGEGPAMAGKPPQDFEARAGRVRLPKEGYVQSIEVHEILHWAVENRSVVRLDFRPGDFVVDGDHKVMVCPAPADPEQVRREIGRFIVSGRQRTPTQDVEFAIRHLVEVAVRALSPGINDPFTALAVIDRLRGGLARIAARQTPSPILADANGEVRIVRRVSDFPGIVAAAFDQIRQAGARMPSVLIHMLQAIASLAEHLRTEDQREVMRRHADLLRAAAADQITDRSDLEDVERAFQQALSALHAGPLQPGPPGRKRPRR